jgi:hypothetical protein
MQRIGAQQLPLASHNSGALQAHASGPPQPSLVVLQPTPGSPHFFGWQQRLFTHFTPLAHVPQLAAPPQPSLTLPHCLSAGHASGLQTSQMLAVICPQTLPAAQPPQVMDPPQPFGNSPHSPAAQVVFGVHGLQTWAACPGTLQ